MAPVTGPVIVELQALGAVDPIVYVLDASGNEIARNDNLNTATTSSRVLFDTQAGQTYFVRAAADEASTGDYQLRLISYSDDAGNTRFTGRPVNFTGQTAQVVGAAIERVGDVDFHSFVATFTGDLIVTLTTQTSSFRGQLTALDAAGTQLTQRLAGSGSTEATVIFGITQGQTYHIRAESLSAQGGRYGLRFGPLVDDVGDTANVARTLTLDASGAGTQRGTAGSAGSGDVDFFQFVASFTGSLAVRLEAGGGGALDPTLTVLDASETVLVFNDDTGESLNSRVALEVQQGQTYFVQVASLPSSPGEYLLTLAPYADDASNQFAAARALTVAPTGATTQAGRIEVTGDQDLYSSLPPSPAASSFARRLRKAVPSMAW